MPKVTRFSERQDQDSKASLPSPRASLLCPLPRFLPRLAGWVEVCRRRQEGKISINLSCWGRNVGIPESSSRLSGLAVSPATTLLRTGGCFPRDGLLRARLPARRTRLPGSLFGDGHTQAFPIFRPRQESRRRGGAVTDRNRLAQLRPQ